MDADLIPLIFCCRRSCHQKR